MSSPNPERIVAELHRFQVRLHYHETPGGSPTRYAVFAQGQQLTRPDCHRVASAKRDRLIADAILRLFEGGAS